MKHNQTDYLKQKNPNSNVTKIFQTVLNKNSRTIKLNPKTGVLGQIKYLPSFAKEWKNSIYSFNKNNLKNLPVNDLNINKIIQSYFDLFFKNSDFLGDNLKSSSLRKRRTFFRRIFVSDAEIKHTSSKVKVTLYIINREKKILKKKYKKLYKRISFKLLNYSISIYKNYLKNISLHLKNIYNIRNADFFETNLINKKSYLRFKLNYLSTFLKLNNLLLKKIWSFLIKNQSKSYITLLRKYNLLYSLNHFKLNKLVLLPKLSNILSKITGKKLEYNIINLKSISYNTDVFTKVLALKIKKTKRSYMKAMLSVVNKAYFPVVNSIQERTKLQTWGKLDIFRNKYKNLNILSNIYNDSISNLLTIISENSGYDNKKIYNLIYDSIKYKNISGIQIEVKGRLTKRYRADRSVFSLKRKGGLKNTDSSFKGLSSVLYRGNTNSNMNYSFSNSKRRVGAFAVKGWIGGK